MIKKGDKVNFQFQGRWNVKIAGDMSKHPNTGTVTEIRDNEVIVRAPAGSRFYLPRDHVRSLEEMKKANSKGE